MTATRSGLTICGWIRKSRENHGSYGSLGAGAWFNYGVVMKSMADSSEILLLDGMREVRRRYYFKNHVV